MEQRRKRGGFFKVLRKAAVLLIVLLIGVNIGNGRLDLSSNPDSANKQLPSDLNYGDAEAVYDALRLNYSGKLTEQQVQEGLKQGLTLATDDPYTTYFTAKEAAEFQEQINNQFSGIGAQLGTDKEGNLEVITPIEGLPAEKAGLKAKDLIASINGTPTTGMSVDEAVSKIRGPKGTVVKLQVVRNRAQAIELAITRDEIKIPSVKTKLLEGNIGHIEITDFSDDTASLTEKAARDFKSKSVKGVILDLRNNGGGYLDASERIASLWLPEGKKILDQKGTDGTDSSYASGNNVLQGVPTVVLINGGSASASEIVAGALLDNKAAYIIGEKSYGKGVVQELISFRDGSQLKVTTASWYRPNGQNIDKKGIKPNREVKLTEQDTAAGKDPQLEAAQAHLKR
jgi:carboxyl-terminal processing protease